MRRGATAVLLTVACGGGSGSNAAGDDAGSMATAGSGGPSSGAGADSDGATGMGPGADSSADSVGDSGQAPTDIWQPPPRTTWQWQLTGQIDTLLDVDMYDVDLFAATDDELAALSDRVLICYFSAGSYEEWRDDAGDFPAEALGQELDGWPGERWLDHRDSRVHDIMLARLDVAVMRGCDGVEPDNVDGYDNATGFDLTAQDQLDYNRFLAGAAHDRGLSIGLKNDVEQIPELVDEFDWALNEECHAYNECDGESVFTQAGKAVFHTEYVDDWADADALASEVCGNYPDLSTLIKTWDLGPEFLPC